MKTTTKQKIHNRIKILALTGIIASLTAIIISSNILIAKAGVGDNNGHDDTKLTKKYYSSITIKNDDTLWSISERFKNEDETNAEYIKNIMEMNNMTDDTIYSGMQLAYYYYEEL